MARAIDLDPGTYGGTYKLIGGAPALDFANLVSYRATDRQHDWLEPAGNITKWAEAAGLDASVVGTDTARPRKHRELRELREVLARVFLAIADGETPDAHDMDEIGRLAAAAWRGRRLELEPGSQSATWSDPVPSLLGTLASDAAALLTSPEALARIRACGECRWVFLDTTRNQSRQWCDPADCGNRARQRRHYQRRANPRQP